MNDLPSKELSAHHPAQKLALHTLDKTKLDFYDPAQLLILSHIIDKIIENPTSTFSPEQIQELDAFLKTAHALGNDITELMLLFKEHMPLRLPVSSVRGALIEIIENISKTANSDPSISEISAIAQLFRALATICSASGLIHDAATTAKELDIAATLWEEGEIQTSDILRVTYQLKQKLQI